MKEYKLLREQAKSDNKKNLLVSIFIFLMIIALSELYTRGYDSNYSTSLDSVLLPLLLIIVALFIGFRSSRKMNNEAIESFRIELFDNGIKRFQEHTPTVEIEKQEISSIHEVKNKGIIIKTKNENKYIFIPASLDGYIDLKKTISEWKQIENKENNMNQLIRILVSLGGAIGFYTFMFSKNSYIVISLGILLSVFLIWSMYKIQTNQNIDERVKKSFWIILLPIISIFLKTLAHIFLALKGL